MCVLFSELDIASTDLGGGQSTESLKSLSNVDDIPVNNSFFSLDSVTSIDPSMVVLGAHPDSIFLS